jgi:hypothetical protein
VYEGVRPQYWRKILNGVDLARDQLRSRAPTSLLTCEPRYVATARLRPGALYNGHSPCPSRRSDSRTTDSQRTSRLRNRTAACFVRGGWRIGRGSAPKAIWRACSAAYRASRSVSAANGTSLLSRHRGYSWPDLGNRAWRWASRAAFLAARSSSKRASPSSTACTTSSGLSGFLRYAMIDNSPACSRQSGLS